MTIDTEPELDAPAPEGQAADAAAGADLGPATPADDLVEEDLADDLVEEDLLVEDVSIDGMCGVY